MKSKVIGLILLAIALPAIAGQDVSGSAVVYVYQPDLLPTEFEFLSDKANSCGSKLYRVISNDEATANRKFSMVLAAFSSNKKIAFHDTQTCNGSRSIVSWVRITN